MTNIFLALLILVLLIKRQIQPRPIKSSLYIFPIILLLYGSYLASDAGVKTLEGISLGLSVFLGLLVGLVQGRFTRVFQQNGIWMVAGSFLSLSVWLLSIPIRFLIKMSFILVLHIPVHLTGEYSFVPYLFSLAGIIGGRAIYLAIKYPKEFKAGTSTSRYERKQAKRSNRTY
jgi:hypothetical protein